MLTKNQIKEFLRTFNMHIIGVVIVCAVGFLSVYFCGNNNPIEKTAEAVLEIEGVHFDFEEQKPKQ